MILPFAGEAREQEQGSVTADAQAAKLPTNEKLAQAVMPCAVALRCCSALDQRKPGRLAFAQDQEHNRSIIAKPALHEFGRALAGDHERREHAGVIGTQVGEVLAIGLLDPVAVLLRGSCLTEADRHRVTRKRNRPDGRPRLSPRRPPGRLAITLQDLRLRCRLCRSLGRRGGISRSFGRRSGISRSFGSRRHFRRNRCGFLGRSSSFFLLTTAGAQQKGNRNGAPDLCIHRQLPQVRSVRKER